MMQKNYKWKKTTILLDIYNKKTFTFYLKVFMF